jgi:broad specificity phosphatase PhoE
MKTLFWLVRHGTTTDSNRGIIRGDRNSMLDRQGFNDAHALKDFFKKNDWHGIFSSDMTRAEQTAKIIADDRFNEVADSIYNLRPWDVGYLTGKDKKIYGRDITVFVEHPDMRPQDGESRNEFFQRVFPLLINAMEIGLHGEHPPIIVGHSSVIHALAHLLWGEDHPPLAVKPGGLIKVFVDKKGKIGARPVLKPGKDDSSFAGKTPPTS